MRAKCKSEKPKIESEAFEMEHRNCEDNYRQVLDNVSDGVISFEVCEGGQFRIIEINSVFELATGFVRNQLIGKTIEEVTAEKTAREITEQLCRCMEAQSTVEDEILFDFPTGNRLFQLTLIPVHNKNDQAYRIIGIARDITDGRQVEEALEEKNRHTQALLRLSRNLERAQSYGEILDAAFEEVKTVIGYQRLWVYLLTEDKKYADLFTAGGKEFEMDISRLSIEGDQMLEEIAIASNIVVVEDAQIDERVDKEIVALLKNRTIVNVPIIFFDRHLGTVGTGTFGDEGVRVPTAMEYEFLSALASHMAVSLDRIHSMIERKKAEEALRDTNVELETHRHHLEALVGERTRELSLARDAAESSNRAKSIFLANMSHELRTPLNAILGFTQLMNRDKSIPDHAQKNLAIINRSGEHLLSMINDVLDLSKIEAGKIELKTESFDLVRTMEDIGEMIRARAREKRLEVIVDLAPDIQRYIKADLGKIRQILINLLGNAVKFTDNGGIALRVRTLRSADNAANVLLDIEVEDTGPGIPKNRLEMIFTPFIQVGSIKSSLMGTGLGLTISQSYVRMMGGEITVSSEEGKGSIFKLQVAVEIVSEDMISIAEMRQLTAIGLEEGEPEYRILIVEDNTENADLLETLLAQVGFSTRIARDGKEGTEIAESWRPHFIWMDIKMPVMDGYEATRHIRSHSWGKEIIIMAFTASVFSDQENKIIEAGCNGILHKPFREQEIFSAMTEYLGVRFRYSETSDGATIVESDSSLSLTPPAEEIESLSKEIAECILKAAAELDKRSIFTIADELIGTHRNIAAYLKNQASSYNFEAIEMMISPYIESKKAS